MYPTNTIEEYHRSISKAKKTTFFYKRYSTDETDLFSYRSNSVKMECAVGQLKYLCNPIKIILEERMMTAL